MYFNNYWHDPMPNYEIHMNKNLLKLLNIEVASLILNDC